jgi:hypothetical protein
MPGMGQTNAPPGTPGFQWSPEMANPQISTHDQVTTVQPQQTPGGPPVPTLPPDLGEAWADVKSPGNGRHYAVGTANVITTQAQYGPTFSGVTMQGVDLPWGAVAGEYTSQSGRQVVVVQCTDDAGAIAWQRYFYGASPLQAQSPPNYPATQHGWVSNARSISVWPDANPDDTRVVICGETSDSGIPQNGVQSEVGTALLGNVYGAGFIAVYNGNGTLLWTRYLSGAIATEDCAVTDVSVRVEYNSVSGAPQTDVVTYCGMTSVPLSGNPSLDGPLSPVNAFPAPPSWPGHTPASGFMSNGGSTSGGWDGFVGRVTATHQPPTATALPQQVLAFHAVVGGASQDGLFGIAEITENRFVVVGTCSNLPVHGQPSGASFPFTHTNPPNPGSQSWSISTSYYDVGIVATFDFSTGTLALEACNAIGKLPDPNPPAESTNAYDVYVQRDAVLPGAATAAKAAIHVVGVTTDPALAFNYPFQGQPIINSVLPTPATNVPSDGFLLTIRDEAGVGGYIDGRTFSYHGGPYNDALYGVSGWNEYFDHIVVSGIVRNASNNADIDVGSYFFDSALTPGDVAIPVCLRRSTPGGGFWTNADEQPNALGMGGGGAGAWTVVAGTGAGGGQLWYGSDPHGGGVSVDQRGRANVVGATWSTDYPVIGTTSRGRISLNPFRPDAVRTAWDMVPPQVGRTDTTGNISVLPTGFAPPPPANGGMTPFCALSPFGRQIGRPVPILSRAHIDWARGGSVGPNSQAEVLVDRLPNPASAPVVGIAIQYDLPSAVPIVILGVELWTSGPTAQIIPFGSPPIGTLRLPFGVLPPAPFQCTVQLWCLTAASFTCNGNSAIATPGLFFSY